MLLESKCNVQSNSKAEYFEPFKEFEGEEKIEKIDPTTIFDGDIYYEESTTIHDELDNNNENSFQKSPSEHKLTSNESEFYDKSEVSEGSLQAILKAIKDSEKRTEIRIQTSEKIAATQFQELKGLIRNAHKDISDIYEVAVRTQIWEMIAQSFPTWKVLWPLGGKELSFAHFSSSESDANSHNKRVLEAYQNLFSKLPNSRYENKRRKAFPEIVEADCIFKFRTGANKLNENFSPNTFILPNLSLKHVHFGLLPQSHCAQSFHHLAVAEISRSRHMCNTSERYIRSYGSKSTDFGTLELLRKFLQLERVIWSLKSHYKPEDDDFIQLTLIASPSFRGLDNRAENLIDAVLATDP
ncbi:hypothetical protein HK096_009855, partial [Nowakowskiella sp. JEL0078]